MGVAPQYAHKLRGFWGPLSCSLGLHALAVLILWAGGWMPTPPGPQVFEVLLASAPAARPLPAAAAAPQRRQPVAQVAPRPVPAQRPPTAATPVAATTAAPSAEPIASAPAEENTAAAPAVLPPAAAAAAATDFAPGAATDALPSAETAATADERLHYLALVRDAIETRKDYPPTARRSRQQGTVVLRFHLACDGQLLEVAIATSSRHSLLDRAAMRAVEEVGRFPPFPAALGREALTFEVPVAFRLDGS